MCWEKDYFTSCRPNAQKGEEVTIPLLGDAPVVGTLSGSTEFESVYKVRSTGNTVETNGTDDLGIDGNARMVHRFDVLGQEVISHKHPLATAFEGEADLSETSGITISDFRFAVAKQKFFELLSRGGNRIQEFYWNVYGVRTSDTRLMMPEYLGGGISPVVISDVMQNTPTDTSPLGAMAGKGTGVQVSHQFNNRFEEHGWIIGLCTVVPRSSYGEGMPRKFTQTDRFDYYFPQFANISEQPVLREEVKWIHDNVSYNKETFGYQAPFQFHR